MKCRDCKFLSAPRERPDQYPAVTCTRGIWNQGGGVKVQWYAYAQTQLNRGPVRKLGESCKVGRPQKRFPPAQEPDTRPKDWRDRVLRRKLAGEPQSEERSLLSKDFVIDAGYVNLAGIKPGDRIIIHLHARRGKCITI